MTAVRHLLSIVLLPGVVAGVVPFWIARRSHVRMSAPATPFGGASVVLGVGLLAVGLALFISSLWRFAAEGEGTLAPWDPPRRLVVRGPYRYVRNPMISGVLLILAAEAALLRSLPHLEWAAAFFAINLIYIPLLEEPDLAQRFGADYRRYCAHVPRFVPRRRPWTGGDA